MFIKFHKNIANGIACSDAIHLLVHHVIKAKFHRFGSTVKVDKTYPWKSWAELNCYYEELQRKC